MSEKTLIARALPKVVLHDHLDGSLRPATLLELLAERGSAAPAASVEALVNGSTPGRTPAAWSAFSRALR